MRVRGSASLHRWTLVVAWLLALGGGWTALQRPRPLFLNLGAGDEAFARGFRGGWERDGLQGSGETMFHWTADGARLEFPVAISSGRLTVRLRLARFAEGDAEIDLEAGGETFAPVDRWNQRPRGWTVREVTLGEVRGPLRLRFRSVGPDELGLALDWVEIRGAERLRPTRAVWAGLLAFLFGVPLVAAFALGLPRALALAVGLSALTVVVLLIDRLGGLCALAAAGAPTVLAVAVLAGLDRLRKRLEPEAGGATAGVVAVVLALLALSHPFYYYPDVDTHARFAAAIRDDPSLALDPRPFQVKTGAWTRTLGRQRVAFPYSPAFHVAALPFAALLGEVAAVKTVGAIALGATVLLVSTLARVLGLPPVLRVFAQLVTCLIPVTASRLVLALYPTLLGQALELLLLLFLARAWSPGPGGPSMAGSFALLAAVQAAYTGSLFGVGAVMGLFVLATWAGGERALAARLALAWLASATVVLLALYARFLPVLWTDVLPQGRVVAEGGSPSTERALVRLRLFFDLVYPALLIPGGLALRNAPALARRAVGAALGAGLLLLGLRYAAPGLFRDAKEVELLTPSVAVVAAAALGWLWARGVVGRALAAAAAGAILHFGCTRAAAFYGERFVAIGR